MEKVYIVFGDLKTPEYHGWKIDPRVYPDKKMAKQRTEIQSKRDERWEHKWMVLPRDVATSANWDQSHQITDGEQF